MNLNTSRLSLREYTISDWQAVLAYQTNSEYLEYYPWHKRTSADVQKFVQMFVDWQQERPRVKFQLAIVLPDQNQLIGSCGIRKKQPKTHQAELGYEIAPLYWGQGYATEAAQKMLDFGFEQLDLHRVWASCLVENKASARVLEKLGLRQEGRIRQNRWMKGRYRDTFVYGILKHEWAEMKNTDF